MQSHYFFTVLVAGLFVLSAMCQEVDPNNTPNDAFNTPNCMPGTDSSCTVFLVSSSVTATGVTDADGVPVADSVDNWALVVPVGASVDVTITTTTPSTSGGLLRIRTRAGVVVSTTLLFDGSGVISTTLTAGEYVVTVQDIVGDGPLPYGFTLQSTPTPGITNDPHFTGLRGQQFLVNGISGNVYNIISTPNMQVNAVFDHIDTFKLDAESTWITEAAVQVRTSDNTETPLQRVYVAAQADGSIAMMLNGAQIAISSVDLAVVHEPVEHSGFKIVRTSERDLILMNSEFVLEINVDPIGHAEWCSSTCPHIDINAYAAKTLQVLSDVGAHGLFGQTWRDHPVNAGTEVSAIEGEPQQYIVRDGLWGKNFKFNRF